MNFVDDFLDYTRIYESPTSFWKWSAFTTISAILRDSVYKPEGDTNLYPNMYTLLMASSAVQRKDKPPDFCEMFCREINNTKIIVGRSSIQAILEELARGETDKNTGRILRGGSAIMIAPELSSSLVSDTAAVNILTDIYKYRKIYKSILKSGTFTIKEVCFSCMMASNKAMLTEVYDSRAIFGGLLGRTFLVTPDEFRSGKSLFNVGNREEQYQSLLDKLRCIAKLSGPFTFTREAQDEYDSWYIPFRESYRDKEDRSGIAGRIHTGVIKLSMILSVNYSCDMVVKKEHIEESIKECMALVPNYAQLTMESGRSHNAQIGMIVLNELYAAPGHTLSRTKLFQRHWNSFNEEEFDKLMVTLIGGQLVRQDLSSNEMIYQLTDKCLEIIYSKKGL